MGNPGWSFDEVLPFFRRLEADADFGDEWHDTQGPVPIRRHPPAELNPVQAAFIEAACAYGLAYVADHNRPGAAGVGPMPRNARAGVRMSTALTYLTGARGRPNLTVRGGAMADRIEVRGGTATGVHLAGGEVVTAGKVVLAAGAYASPAILQRSGIGAASLLGSLGIAVVADLPGVGNNLADHPLVAVDLPARAGTTGPRFQTMATMRSQLQHGPRPRRRRGRGRARAGARHRAPACRRRVHHAGDPLRQHQPAHHHDRRTSCLLDHCRKARAMTDIAELHTRWNQC
jgi:choline dehydrogenase